MCFLNSRIKSISHNFIICAETNLNSFESGYLANLLQNIRKKILT